MLCQWIASTSSSHYIRHSTTSNIPRYQDVFIYQFPVTFSKARPSHTIVFQSLLSLASLLHSSKLKPLRSTSSPTPSQYLHLVQSLLSLAFSVHDSGIYSTVCTTCFLPFQSSRQVSFLCFSPSKMTSHDFLSFSGNPFQFCLHFAIRWRHGFEVFEFAHLL